MAEEEKGIKSSKQASGDIYKALETSSGVNRSFLLTFLLFEVYMLITVGLTNDIQLLVPNRGVHLPFVNMEIPIIQFYIIAPILLLAVHFNLLMHLYQHSMKLVHWQKEVASMGEEGSDLVPPFLFNYVVRYQKGDASYYLLTGSLYLIIYFFPLAVLFMTQVIFSKYHSLPMTLWHFLVLFFDLQFSMLYWRRIICPGHEAEGDGNWKQTLKEQNKLVFAPLLKIILLVPVWNAMLIILRCATQPRGTLGDIRSRGVIRYYYDLTLGKVNILLMFSSLVIIFSIVNVILMVSLSTGLYPKDPSFRWLYPNLNLREADLITSGQTGVGIDLKERCLEFANFKGATMQLYAPGAAFQGADLRGAKMVNANLEGANLEGASLIESRIENANLRKANLQIANMVGAKLQNAVLSNSDLRDAYLMNAIINGERANLDNAKLQMANMNAAELQKATLIDANFQGANLYGIKLQEANLTGANLQGTNLNIGLLLAASLSEAQLQGAGLQSTRLQGANLSYADLMGANLDKAKLQGAILSEANLSNAVLNGIDVKYYLGETILNAKTRENMIGMFLDAQIKNKEELNKFLAFRRDLPCKFRDEMFEKTVDDFLKGEYSAKIAEGLLDQYSDGSIMTLIKEFDNSLSSEGIINNMQSYMNQHCPNVASKVDWNRYLTK